MVVQNGEIVERGTHAELLERGGVYHDMWMRQLEASKAHSEDGAAEGKVQEVDG
jgi:ATP-binding cassette subfamily B protein